MKQADSRAHSSGRSGGDSLVLDCPAAGVLQKMPMATGCIPLPDAVLQPNDGPAREFRHFTIRQGDIAARTRARDVRETTIPAEKCLGAGAPTVYAASLPACRKTASGRR